MEYDVKDLKAAKEGRGRIEWADRTMPVLRKIRERFEKEKPLKGLRISACLHITSETANLARTLKAGGADVALCASNPLSTQDDAAASLVKDFGIKTFAIKGENSKQYYSHITSALNIKPHVTMDDGADLVTVLHTKKRELLKNIIGGTEETTTGVIRLRSMADHKVLRYPIIAVNDAQTKHFFDNRYGTGQSTIDGILRATNLLFAGLNVVVSGYGWCGKGVSMRAKGMGSNVIITEVDPVKALEAVMDGYRVMSMSEAAAIGDIFITVTGNKHIVRKEHFTRMKDGAVIANSGHFNVEIDIPALESLSRSKKIIRKYVEEYALKNGRKLYLLGEGRLINLASAEGHPAVVMDMSFANQSLSVEYISRNHDQLEKDVYPVPEKIDREVARLKLATLHVKIDRLSSAQKQYLSDWIEGT
jgi:adenosylhomocysteinase